MITTMSSSDDLPAPDWYEDPLGVAERRYWDGSQWTGQTFSPIPDSVPMPAPPGHVAEASMTSDGEQVVDRTHTSEGHLILTDRVERMLDIEQRLGVRIDSMLAVFVQTDYDTEVVILGDLVAEQGLRTTDLQVVVTTYNESGQVTGKEDDYLDLGKSIAPAPFALRVDIDQPPARIRLMAKPL